MNKPQPTPTIAPDLIWRELDRDAVIVSPKDGKVRVLNGVGTAIWRLLVENRTVSEIEQHLVSNYEVTLEQAHLDVEEFLTDLSDRKLVTLHPEGW